jgi:tripartite-type tricarboxylate transporter receptor subunit TctC
MFSIPAAALALLVAAVLFPPNASADTYPSRPLRIIVPWPAGTGADIAARIVAQKLGDTLRQNVVVDNRGGASGTIGSALGARETADGYTLIWGNGTTHGAAKVVYPNLPYDPRTDFTPISLVNKNLLVIAVHKDFPASTIAELVKYAKANAGRVSYGTPGMGTPHMLAGELLNKRAGIDLVHVPYKGGGQVMSDLLGGHIQMAVSPMAIAADQHRAGRIKILAVVDQQRIPTLPQVPSLSELYADVDIAPWSGLFGPKNLRSPIVKQLNEATVRLLEAPDVKRGFEGAGFIPTASTPQELGAKVSATIARWQELVRSGIKVTN